MCGCGDTRSRFRDARHRYRTLVNACLPFTHPKMIGADKVADKEIGRALSDRETGASTRAIGIEPEGTTDAATLRNVHNSFRGGGVRSKERDKDAGSKAISRSGTN